MEHAEILHRCFRCGYCKLPGNYMDLNCPSYLKFRFETYSPGGRMWLLRAWLDGEIKTSPRLADIFFSCATCGNCVEHCVFPKFKDDILNAFLAGKSELVDQGAVPPTVRDFLKAIHVNGNPYKLPQAERGDWADGLDIAPFKDQEYLLYVGCVGSYDERGKKMVRSVARVLQDWGVSFGILGAHEHCDGNDVCSLGEKGLFRQIAEQNIKQFSDLNVEKIITLSPHAYHAMKNEYPQYGAQFDVYHYSQMIRGLINKVSLKPKGAPVKVTFHDPCYLGRHNEEYSAPRKILRRLRNVQFVEMDRSKSDALCCGGGGGNFFSDLLGQSQDSPARVRIREAVETGASVVGVACPNCAKMLEDATKSKFLDDKIQIMDLAEIIRTFTEQ
ncbi:MAG: (Fe-S)-binding protein [Deltaproteobacteria bacterium]